MSARRTYREVPLRARPSHVFPHELGPHEHVIALVSGHDPFSPVAVIENAPPFWSRIRRPR